MALNAKRRAAEGALSFLEGAEVIGIGTGSTIMEFIDLMKPDTRLYVPSSAETVRALSSRGFRVAHPSSVSHLDIYVDGADEVDADLNMIKGRGGALTMEKLLTHYARSKIFVVDDSKIVSRLGERGPVPIEILPEALGFVEEVLRNLGLHFEERTCAGKRGPLMSDTRGYILDVEVPRGADPANLDHQLRFIRGVVETGFFLGMADAVVVGYPDRARILTHSI